MKNLITIILFCIVTTIGLAQTEKYNKGLMAFDAKEYSNALKYLKPYADSGDSMAQFVVGFCYYNKELKIKNDSISEYYLLKSAEQKYGRAMGLLSVLYFGKGMDNSKYKIEALVWAETAAAYDPIQKATTTRFLIKAYMSEEELKIVENLLKEKKKTFDKIDLASYHAYNAKISEKSAKTKIPENTLGLTEDPYRDWVSRWKYEKFECDTMYYTANIDKTIIDATISELKNKKQFEVSDLYSGSFPNTLTLTNEEQLYLITELNKLKDLKWESNLFPSSKRIETTQIETAFTITEKLRTEDEKNMCSIIYTFSKPIYFRNGKLCLFLDQKRYRTNYTQLNFSFFVLEKERWEELATAYQYYESSKK